MLRRRKGQSVLEYAVIIAVVVGALLAMQIYMKRGLENRMRQAGDDVGKQFALGATHVSRNTTRCGLVVETVALGATNTETSYDNSTLQAREDIGNYTEGFNP